MITHNDRQPTKPNRRQIVPENGSDPYYATIAYADEPTSEGSLVNKEMLDEFLSASGITTGTASTLALVQEGFALADGAAIRCRAHLAINGQTTLNVQGTGAKPVVQVTGDTAIVIAAQAWFTVVYSEGLDKYVLQGTMTSTPTFASVTMNGNINMANHYIDNALFR